MEQGDECAGWGHASQYCPHRTHVPGKDPLLHRYWIEFEREPARRPEQFWLPLGCGVTAYTREDALALIQRQVYRELPLPPLSRVLEDVDLSQMEAHWRGSIGVPLWHLLGEVNRATPVWRGVWYPFNGYELR